MVFPLAMTSASCEITAFFFFGGGPRLWERTVVSWIHFGAHHRCDGVGQEGVGLIVAVRHGAGSYTVVVRQAALTECNWTL
ncbi:MAG TPA: hypothetical protein DEF45_11790 [Rhodopirellula sp.]|nr:hypothetical protein [Rhodopirellula sp.]